MTISAFSAFGVCGRECIKSAFNEGYTSFTCGAAATPANCVCQHAASTVIYDGIVGCVNYRCEPSSTSLATQIFESYCEGDIFPTPLIQAITPMSNSQIVTEISGSQTQSASPNTKTFGMND
jgi:hypothetical protein